MSMSHLGFAFLLTNDSSLYLEQSRYLHDVENNSFTVDDEMRLQHALSINQDQDMSIMTENDYLLMDINHNLKAKCDKGHFSQISSGGVSKSNCDEVVKAPIKFSASFDIVLDEDKVNDNENDKNTECDDEK